MLDAVLKIIDDSNPINIVDIGANPYGDGPVYKPLLDGGLAHLVGFEPDAKAFAQLQKIKQPHETYLPYAIGDGQAHLFHSYQSNPASVMNSILELDQDKMARYQWLAENRQLIDKTPIATKRLDDIAEIKSMDFLCMDIQGAELLTLKNGVNKLKDCLLIHTEAVFTPTYHQQPTFADLDVFLRGQGFQFLKFHEIVWGALKPFYIDKNPRLGFSQMLFCDALFIRDLDSLQQLAIAPLAKLILVLHELYQAYDLAHFALKILEEKLGENLTQHYRTALKAAIPEVTFVF
jgi:FkbM family methyltransferase